MHFPSRVRGFSLFLRCTTGYEEEVVHPHLLSRLSCRMGISASSHNLYRVGNELRFLSTSMGLKLTGSSCCSGWTSGGICDLFPVVEFTTGCVVQRILRKRPSVAGYSWKSCPVKRQALPLCNMPLPCGDHIEVIQVAFRRHFRFACCLPLKLYTRHGSVG